MNSSRKTVMITGAADGLGWGLAKAFLKLGFHLFLIDRDSKQLQTRVRTLENQRVSQNQCIDSLIVDLLEEHAVSSIAQAFNERHSKLDVLINNAGITHRSLATETDIAVTKRVMSLDYFVPVELTQRVLPALKNAGAETNPASIINIGSMAGWLPVLGRSGYCAAKSALHQYFETFRAENAHQPLHVLMVYPSFLATRIEQNAMGANGQPAAHARSTTGKIHSVDWMVQKIISAYQHRQERLFPNKPIMLASLLYRHWPSLFIRAMRRKFASELNTATANEGAG
jgi:short-subunit dehydrogenase